MPDGSENKQITKGDPFGVGHRACPGRALSMAVIERLRLTLFDLIPL